MRIPETHEHTCAICNTEYVSFTSIDWGTCDNCENRARQYKQKLSTRGHMGKREMEPSRQEEILHDLYEQEYVPTLEKRSSQINAKTNSMRSSTNHTI